MQPRYAQLQEVMLKSDYSMKCIFHLEIFILFDCHACVLVVAVIDFYEYKNFIVSKRSIHQYITSRYLQTFS